MTDHVTGGNVGDVNTPDEALNVLIAEADWADMHGGDNHDDECPICRSIAMLRAALNHAYPASNEALNRRAQRAPGWGQIVQLLLRAMDTSPKTENAAALAERMADGVQALYGQTTSAPVFKASHPPRMAAQGERDPSVMPDCAGAKTNSPEQDSASAELQNQPGINQSLSESAPREGASFPSTLLGTEPSAPASEDRTDGR